MIEIQDVSIRLNKDVSDSDRLVGWGDFYICSQGIKFYVNNVKIKRREGDNFKIYLEYPHKIVNRNGKDEPKYYIKPINFEAYRLVEKAFIHKMYEEMEALKDV